jgi:hypothetical protein
MRSVVSAALVAVGRTTNAVIVGLITQVWGTKSLQAHITTRLAQILECMASHEAVPYAFFLCLLRLINFLR